MPLIINKKHINKISGPVSMYLLYPKIEYTDITKNKYAPIFILFGDSHEGIENYCNPDEGEDKGHYKIYDENFLKLFSDAMEGNEEEKVKSEIIDFYVEVGDLHITEFQEGEEKNEYPLDQIIYLFKDCYYNVRGIPALIPEKQKKLKNIRWQSGDIRYFIQKNDICDLYSEFENIIQECNRDEKLFKKMLIKAIEYNYGNSLTKAFTQEELYREHVLNPNCLIYKQLNNINLGIGDENIKNKKEIIEEILLKFRNYIYEYYLIFDITRHIEKYKKIHIEIINTFTSEYGSKIRKELIDNIYNYYKDGSLEKLMSIILTRDAVLPDLYILARNYKYMYTTVNPKYGVRHPMINICYFGCAHIQKMYEFLMKNGYKEVIKIDQCDDKKTNRCIDLTNLKTIDLNTDDPIDLNTVDPIDLNAIITQLKKQRSGAITQEKSGGKSKRRTK